MSRLVWKYTEFNRNDYFQKILFNFKLNKKKDRTEQRHTRKGKIREQLGGMKAKRKENHQTFMHKVPKKKEHHQKIVFFF